jgi:hypothetical protein
VGETVRETRWEAEVTHHRHAVHRQPVGGGVERQRVATMTCWRLIFWMMENVYG